MSLVLRLLGAGALMLFALIFGREYSAYVGRRIAEGEAFLALVSHIERMISEYLAPPEVIFTDFCSDELEHCGFLPAVRSGLSPADAIISHDVHLSVSTEIRDRLKAYFSVLGRSYREGELAAARECLADLGKIQSVERRELQKSVNLTRTLLLCVTMGITILIV